MKQYYKIKDKYPDAILLFRVGDFYETFHEDAIKTSKILGIILTKRGSGTNKETKLAGFPHHALKNYLYKLVRAGERVAICDQLEDPKMTKSIVKRGVTELITPGVSLNDEVLDKNSNNFLASIFNVKEIYAISFLDISTGEFLSSHGNLDYIKNLLQSFDPKEILISKKNKTHYSDLLRNFNSIFFLDDWIFKKDFSVNKIKNQFKIKTLKGFGFDDENLGILTCGAILHYLDETKHDKLSHITNISLIRNNNFVWMDRFTMRNLELLSANSNDGVSLIDIIDKTSSPMGSRMLKRWIIQPEISEKELEFRHDCVAYFKENYDFMDSLILTLKSLSDLERIISKIAAFKITPRELVQLKGNLKTIGPLINSLQLTENHSLIKISKSLHKCSDLLKILEKTIDDDAPVIVSKGNVIKDGFDKDLDELRSLSKSGKDQLDKILEEETEKTKISSLKISFNNVFGYYLEVRNIHKDKVPQDWIRKQTLVNAERYITQELKEFESKILNAEENILVLENKLFNDLVIKIHPFIKKIKTNSQWLSVLDCLVGFGVLAEKMNYSRPFFNNSNEIKIIEGRHPVIESQLSYDNPYIPNDITISNHSDQILMITGPNMSGKSAILRQTALIVLMAQIGSFVPAKELKMGLIDKIFTRVGASDNISIGESTFMVEMNEAAAIINNISNKSLILLDEIGRGTSTYDGISIAWAIAEFLHDHPFKPKTLFATHYHEINMMAQKFDRIKNFNVSVKESRNNVIFLRKLVEGGNAHSFGIHVARMSGMPKQIINSATKMLKKLESSHELKKSNRIENDDIQLSIFSMDNPKLEEIKEDILSLDLDQLTPVEALIKLNEIKRILNS